MNKVEAKHSFHDTTETIHKYFNDLSKFAKKNKIAIEIGNGFKIADSKLVRSEENEFILIVYSRNQKLLEENTITIKKELNDRAEITIKSKNKKNEEFLAKKVNELLSEKP